MKESFRDFMQRALHHPKTGYYAARIPAVGRGGDFSTSATLSEDLAEGIARWIVLETAKAEVRHVIEIGSGDGSLLASVSKRLGWWQRWKLSFCLVESSARLRAVQQEKLGKLHPRWFATMQDALTHCEGRALIFHNEVIDAFPVRLLEWRAGWHEVFVEWKDGSPHEVLEPLRLAEPSHFSALQASAKEGQRMELMEDVHQWFSGWLPNWKKGSMLSIDYGDEFPRLYHRRPKGTLRAYLLHQRLEGTDVYLNPGRQDITCDVNFTDVRRWLKDAAVTEVRTGTQRELLEALGVSSSPELAQAWDCFRFVWSRR